MAANVHPIRGSDGGTIRDGPPRRLAAILAADISGYSRLMRTDEEGTHARVMRHLRELIEPTIAEHYGRLVKTTGDGFIAIFDSPVEAVRCGIVIQQSMLGRNAIVPRQNWIQYRIGVNLGDVIIDANDVYGDGVNIAARLEGIADPGDLYISGGMYEQIKHKLVCGYQLLGDRHVKNITEPIKVYRVLPDPAAIVQARAGLRRATRLILAVMGLALAGAASLYFFAPQLPFSLQPTKLGTLKPSAPPSSEGPAPSAPGSTTSPPAPTVSAPVVKPQAPATLQSPAQTTPLSPAQIIHEPEMVPLPGGVFSMGSNEDPSEKPIHRVSMKPFLMSKFPISVREWNACVQAKACAYVPTGKDDAPVTNISWNDAQQFISWLNSITKKNYRLPSEAEWEYAARGGTDTRYWWGNQLQAGMVNCKGCNEPYDPTQPAKVGAFKPNPFGLYDMGGGVDQWVSDCWHANYQNAPVDGSAWGGDGCPANVIRSGSWKNDESYVRTASRDHYDTGVRYPTHGFRIARSP